MTSRSHNTGLQVRISAIATITILIIIFLQFIDVTESVCMCAVAPYVNVSASLSLPLRFELPNPADGTTLSSALIFKAAGFQHHGQCQSLNLGLLQFLSVLPGFDSSSYSCIFTSLQQSLIRCFKVLLTVTGRLCILFF